MNRAFRRLTLATAVVALATAPLLGQTAPPAKPRPEIDPQEVFRAACDRLKALEARQAVLKGVSEVKPSLQRDDKKGLQSASFVFERNVAVLRKDEVKPKEVGKPFLFVSVSVWRETGPYAAPPANLMQFQWKGKQYAAWLRVYGSDADLVQAIRKAVDEPNLLPPPQE